MQGDSVLFCSGLFRVWGVSFQVVSAYRVQGIRFRVLINTTETLSPKPDVLNPKPIILGIKPQTLTPKP